MHAGRKRMEIDIIDMSSDEFKNLNATQIYLAYAAQVRKEKILKKASLDKAAINRKLVDQNFMRSTLYAAEKTRIDAEAAADIENLRMELLHQMSKEQVLSPGSSSGIYYYPGNPDYNLSPSERFLVVRDYYMKRTD